MVWGCLCLGGLGMAFIFKLWVTECLLCRLLAALTRPLCVGKGCGGDKCVHRCTVVVVGVYTGDRGPGAVGEFSPEVL